MSWTKRQFVTQAFDEIGLAAYVFDLSPEQLNSALCKLDAMLASWNAVGVRIGYPLPASPNDSDLDQDSGVPDFANEAIYLNLALRIAPSYGKVIMPETKQFANTAYHNLVNQTIQPILQYQLPTTMPLGAGTKYWRNYNNPFVVPAATEPLLAGPDNEIQFD